MGLVLQPLIEASVQAARGAGLDVRAPALLHVSRVLTTQENVEGRRLFDEAVELVTDLDPRSARCLADRVLLIAAAAHPSRVRELVNHDPIMSTHGRMSQVIQTMLKHGHVREAAGYITDPANAHEYPYETVPLVLRQYTNDEQQCVKIVRAAVAAWRRSPVYGFFRVFASHWTMLPPEEARQILGEMLAFVAAQPDQHFHASIATDNNGVEFTSEQNFHLFELLPVLCRLEPDTAKSLCESRPQLAKAAARFPLGQESVIAEQRAASRPVGQGRGYITGGNPKDFPMYELVEAERAGDPEPFFEYAQRLYEEDAKPEDPNLAPRECWPSTQQFRRAFHIAGKERGDRAVELLERAPDGAVRLFSQIALAGALSGLPELRFSYAIFRLSVMHHCT